MEFVGAQHFFLCVKGVAVGKENLLMAAAGGIYESEIDPLMTVGCAAVRNFSEVINV